LLVQVSASQRTDAVAIRIMWCSIPAGRFVIVPDERLECVFNFRFDGAAITGQTPARAMRFFIPTMTVHDVKEVIEFLPVPLRLLPHSAPSISPNCLAR
jgi:hypothetical protein